jgi:hypothetical protein
MAAVIGRRAVEAAIARANGKQVPVPATGAVFGSAQ